MPQLTASTRAAEKVLYLVGKVQDHEDEMRTIKDALREALDAWALEISPLRIGDRVRVRGVPNWDAQVVEVRAASGFEAGAEKPTVVVTVRYRRKDGLLGVRTAAFYDGYNHDWKLEAVSEGESR